MSAVLRDGPCSEERLIHAVIQCTLNAGFNLF